MQHKKAVGILKCKLKKFILLACTFIAAYSLILYENANASDIRNDKHPIFMNVYRVYIYVDYPISIEEKTHIPVMLKRVNIEKRLVGMYKKRFSSIECSDFFKTRYIPLNPYECNDQPVILLSGEDDRRFTRGIETVFSKAGEIHDEGTLYVRLQVRLHGSAKPYAHPLENPIISFLFMQERPGINMSLTLRRPYLSVFPINQTQERLKQPFDGIRSHIH